jgi:hypothetical protein
MIACRAAKFASCIAAMTLIAFADARAGQTTAEKATTEPTAATIQSSYDRFEDVTEITLQVCPELAVGFRYAGVHRSEPIEFATIRCTKFIEGNGLPVELIFLADGRRARLPLRRVAHDSTISMELFRKLVSSEKLEAAILYENGRTEISFSNENMSSLRQLFGLSGYDELMKAKAIEEAAAAAKAKQLREEQEAAQRKADMAAAQALASQKAALFAVTGGRAKRVIFLCQASGSMLTVFTQSKTYLKQSIDWLEPDQTFNIIFTRDDQYYALGAEGPLASSPESKRKANNFIDAQVSTGSTQPIPAIKFAASQQPDLIFILTEGFSASVNSNDIIAAIANCNPDHRIKINCIYMATGDNQKSLNVVNTIAHDNGGTVKRIDSP